MNERPDSRSGPGIKTLRVGIAQPVEQWDPYEAHDSTSHLVLAQLYETPFVQVLMGERPEPAIFEGPLTAELGLAGGRYRGVVRSGRHFSDGTQVTPALVAQSLARSELLAQSVDVWADGDTVVFDADRPRPRLDVTLAKRWCAVTLARDGQFHGTGAFMRAPDSTPERIRLVRNPYYHLTVALDSIIFEVFGPGREAELAQALETGQVHLTMALGPAQANQLSGVRTVVRPGESTGILFFNTQRPALRARDVRHALASGIDRYKLTRIAYPESAGLTAKGVAPPALGTLRDDHQFNRGLARQLESRSPALPPLRMLVVWAARPYLPAPHEIATEIVAQLGAVGVTVEIVTSSSSDDFTRQLREGDYDLVLGGWIAESDEAGDFYESLVSSAAIPTSRASTSAAGNFARFSDRKTDELVERYRDTGDAQALQDLAARISNTVPLLPLMHGASVVVHTERVRNFVPTGASAPVLARVDLD
jgi:ABC-type transport system substrate-binding protein